MEYEILNVDYQESIAIVKINRPQALNALNTRFFQEMDDVVSQVTNKPEIKVMIITGEGKAFVAGADIKEFSNYTPEEGLQMVENGQRIFAKIEKLTKPVIAAVNGFALGGGCELAMSCHLRIASENAKFGLPEVSFGIVPDLGGAQKLSRIVGLGKAKEIV